MRREKRQFSGQSIVSVSRLPKIEAADAAALPTEVQVLKAGAFQTMKYGEVVIGEDILDKIIANFRTNVPDVSVDEDHDYGRSFGWVKDLVKRDGSLWAIVEWTSIGEEAVSQRLYRFVSPTVDLAYQDPETSEYYGPVLVCFALTNYPVFRQSLQALSASTAGNEGAHRAFSMYFNDEKEGATMDMESIKAKALADLSDEEKSFVKEQAGSLSDEDKDHFASILDDSDAAAAADGEGEQEGQGDGDGESNADPAADKGDEKDGSADGEGEQQVEGSDSKRISASELKELKAAQAELLQLKTEKTADQYLMSSKGGKVAPAGKSDLVKLLASMNAEQRELFGKVMASVKTNPVVEGEQGSDSAAPAPKAATQIEALVAKKIESNSKLSYGTALGQVLAENQELASEYRNEQKK